MHNNMLILAYVIICLSYFASTQDNGKPAWHWQCLDGPAGRDRQCIREIASAFETPVSEMSCQQTCGSAGTLVPRPIDVTLGENLVSIIPPEIKLSLTNCQNDCQLLKNAFARMKETVNKYHPKYGKQHFSWKTRAENTLQVEITVLRNETHLTLSTDESYVLDISTLASDTIARINAPTNFGARHALETLSQIIAYDWQQDIFQINSVAHIEDSPAFPYRGLIIDTARNFLPVDDIKRIIDGMSYNKLNSFHWHISDTQAFPMNIDLYPKMAFYGTYSTDKVYTREDIQGIVEYARERGVRVIPELDAPAHVGYGWNWGTEDALGNLVVCLNQQPWDAFCAGPPCGQLNLANDNIYVVLKSVYDEMVQSFGPIEMFHYGGDEVNVNCWNSDAEISGWMIANGNGVTDDDYYEQWSVFQEKARQNLIQANGGVEVPGIMWTSHLTEAGNANRFLDKDQYIIQVWTTGNDPLIGELLEDGYRIIMSNYDALYFDCGVSSWVGKGTNWCSPYKGWQDVYDNDILAIARVTTGSDAYDQQVLGAEGAAWSEQIDENTIDAKLWPRGAALAERLWTNPETNFAEAENRMLQHRQRLAQRGLKPARLQPEWCKQSEAQCPIP